MEKFKIEKCLQNHNNNNKKEKHTKQINALIFPTNLVLKLYLTKNCIEEACKSIS